MSIELDDAVAEMENMFWASWQVNTSAIFGYVPHVEWYGRANPPVPDRSKVWVRFSTQNVFDEQITLSDCVEAPFRRRYESNGLIFVQFFLPKSVDNAVKKGRKLAKVARNVYRGKKSLGGIVFHNVRINDNILPEAEYSRINVVAEYEFDEVG